MTTDVVPTDEERRDAIRALAHPDRLREVFASALFRDDYGIRDQAQAICTLVARLLKCQHAAVNLLTDDRQIAVVTAGADLAPAVKGLNQSVCQHVVTMGEPYIVVDACENALINHTELVKKGLLRCYLGVPLVRHRKQVIGALCVFDSTTRQWSLDDVTLLQAFADLLMSLDTGVALA